MKPGSSGRKMYRILIALIAIIFGVFWMIAASSIGAPWFFSLFGLVFIAIAAFKIIRTVFSK